MTKISRKELRQIIAESMDFEYTDGEPNPMSTADVMKKLRAGENVEGIEADKDDYEKLSAQGRRADLDPDSLSHEDIHTAREPMGNTFERLLLIAISKPESVLPIIRKEASAAGMEPFDYLVSQGMDGQFASNLMAALSQWDQAKMGMTF